MTDTQVDDLLKDLDTALAVDPSPVLVARVRSNVAERQRPAVWQWALGAAAGLAVAAIVVVMTWPRPADDPAPAVPALRQQAAGLIPRPAVEPPRPLAVRVASRPPKAPVTEPVVIISPGVRLGLMQLEAYVRGGRIAGDDALASSRIAPPDPVVLDKLQIAQFKVDPAPERIGVKDIR